MRKVLLVSPTGSKTTPTGTRWCQEARPRLQTISSAAAAATAGKPATPTASIASEGPSSGPAQQRCARTGSPRAYKHQQGSRGTWNPQQIKSTHTLLIQLKTSTTPSDQRLQTEHGSALRAPREHTSRVPRGLRFHFTKLPAYLLFSDGRLGTVHFLKPPAFGQDTHARAGDLPARTRGKGRSGGARSTASGSEASPGAGCLRPPGAHRRAGSRAGQGAPQVRTVG